jgi:hypothetical protein
VPLFRLIHGLNDGSTDATFAHDENPDPDRYEPADAVSATHQPPPEVPEPPAVPDVAGRDLEE